MDFTSRNKIRPNLDYNVIANKEYGKLYRKDSENIFSEMIIDKNLNHTECIVIRTYFEQILCGLQRSEPKSSYYHVAMELYGKVKLYGNTQYNYDVYREIVKKYKFNLNELETFKIYVASLVGLGLTMATLKKYNI